MKKLYIYIYIIVYFSGVGVFANKAILKGEFILEYAGELVFHEEGQKREEEYPEHFGSFLFFYNKYW